MPKYVIEREIPGAGDGHLDLHRLDFAGQIDAFVPPLAPDGGDIGEEPPW
jgi:hypothetical protein